MGEEKANELHMAEVAQPSNKDVAPTALPVQGDYKVANLGKVITVGN